MDVESCANEGHVCLLMIQVWRTKTGGISKSRQAAQNVAAAIENCRACVKWCGIRNNALETPKKMVPLSFA